MKKYRSVFTKNDKLKLSGSFIQRSGRYVKSHWKRLVILSVIIIALYIIYQSLTREPDGITTTKVTRQTLISDFSASGVIKARKAVDLKFYAPGKVTWIGVKNGDEIKSGQVAAKLDQISLNAAYQQSLNNFRNFQATADNVLDQVQGHEKDESFTQIATRTTAEVARDNAYQGIVSAKNSLSNTSLISPISGTVTNINNLTAGINLTGTDIELKSIRVVDFNSLYFEAQVDEIEYAKIAVDQEVSVVVDAFPGESCTGIVAYISRDGQKTAGGVVTFPVEVTLTNCSKNLAVGLNGQASFVISKLKNALIIPKKYIVTKNGHNYVWKQTGSTTKKRDLVEIKLGSTTSTNAQILEGLSETDLIVFIP